MNVKRKVLIAGVTALVLTAGASAATAAVVSSGPVDSSGVIHGCWTMRRSTGLTRSSCRTRARHAQGAPPRFRGTCKDRQGADPQDRLDRQDPRDRQDPLPPGRVAWM